MDDLIGGTTAGLAQTFVGYPLDTIKANYVYGKDRSLVKCIKRMYRKQGVRAFYSGVNAPMIGGVITNAITFVVYPQMRTMGHSPLLAGALTGAVISLTEAPIEHVKCRMQVGFDHIKTKTYTEQIRELGTKHLYRGFQMTVARNITSVGLMFQAYESTKSQFQNKYIGSFIGGAVGGFACWGVLYPLDNLKTRIQTSSLTTKVSLKNELKKIQRKGWSRLWSGYIPCVARGTLVNPFIFLAYEIASNISNLKN